LANWRSPSCLTISTSWRRGTNGNTSAQFSSGSWLKNYCESICWVGTLKETYIFIFGCWNYLLLLRFVKYLTFFSCKNDECVDAYLPFPIILKGTPLNGRIHI
jgi:hypothetical protein